MAHSWIRWLRQEGSDAPKHLGWVHPIVTCSVHYMLVIMFVFWLHDFMIDIFSPYNHHELHPSFISNPLTYVALLLMSNYEKTQEDFSNAIAYFGLSYAVIILVWRLWFATNERILRPSILYEYTWLCNVTLIMCSLGLLSNRPIIVSSHCVAVGIDQILWYVDCLGYITMRKFPVGVAKYLMWPGSSWLTRITSTHHLWTIPLFLFVGCRGFLHPLSYPLSVVIITINVCFSRLMTPFSVTAVAADERHLWGKKLTKKNLSSLSTSFSSSSSTTTVDKNTKSTNAQSNSPNSKYLNVNLSYEFWKDVKIDLLQINYDNPAVHTYLFRLLIRWSGFNFLVYLFLSKTCDYYVTFFL